MYGLLSSVNGLHAHVVTERQTNMQIYTQIYTHPHFSENNILWNQVRAGFKMLQT